MAEILSRPKWDKLPKETPYLTVTLTDELTDVYCEDLGVTTL